MNNKTQKGNVDEQQQNTTRGRQRRIKHNKEQCNNATRNANKIQTTNINQTKNNNNNKSNLKCIKHFLYL